MIELFTFSNLIFGIGLIILIIANCLFLLSIKFPVWGGVAFFYFILQF